VGSTALTFGQIQKALFTDGGSEFCFWHSVRGSRRRKSDLDAETALEWVINIGQVERWQGCIAAEP